MNWMALALAVAMGSAGAAAPDEQPLEPDSAFRPSARLQAGGPSSAAGIEISYRILPGYYLYRDRFRFEVVPPKMLVAAAQLPRGLEIDDPFVGKSFVYRDQVRILLPFGVSVARPGQYRVRITAQGCAEGRLCYAPFVQDLVVNIPPGYRVTDGPDASRQPGRDRQW